MLANLGQIYLILAFAVAICTAVASVAGARRESTRLITFGRNGTFIVTSLYTLSIGVMINAFLAKDFNIQIVAQHTSADLPAIYSFTALYADKSGSVFFWGWLISLMATFVTLQKFRTHHRMMPYALAILAVVQAFFLSLITLVTNVFEKSTVTPAEGMGLNPQLQNIGMLIHPPLLYLGFAGFMIVFAFTMGALLSRSPSKEWTNGIRRWALFAWCALGIGNLVGAWWAYTELGWGGYWAWDPVENAGLMPWLLGTAFIHSIAVLRRRNQLQIWSFALIIFTFAFILLSPFITHGGIESLLHGFTGSPLPPYILGVIVATLVGSLGLLIVRRNDFKLSGKSSSLISVKGAFLLTNIILCIVVLLMIAGTIFPRISEAFGQKVSLERDFFDLSCGPILLVLVFFIGVCPLLEWKKSSWASICRNFAIPFGIASIAAIAILISGIGNWYAVAALVCGFPLFSIFGEWFRETRKRHFYRNNNYLKAFPSLIWSNKPRYGGFIVHIGIILITMGVIGSSMYDVEKTEALEQGEAIHIQDYELTYTDLLVEHEESQTKVVAALTVSQGGNHVATLHPENNYWFNQGKSNSEVAIRTTLTEDLFAALLDFDSETKSTTIRVVVNPLIVWLWIGGGVILIGGIIASWPDRKKL